MTSYLVISISGRVKKNRSGSERVNRQFNEWYTYDVHFDGGGGLRKKWDVIGRGGD